jgi:hypothetical protein
MADLKLLDGMIIKPPRQGAPDFVKGSISFNVEKVIESLRANAKNGWVNMNLKTSREGKMYAEIDTWEPGQARN